MTPPGWGEQLHLDHESLTVFSSQVRVKILAKLSEETKGPLMKLHNCLNGKVMPHPLF